MVSILVSYIAISAGRGTYTNLSKATEILGITYAAGTTITITDTEVKLNKGTGTQAYTAKVEGVDVKGIITYTAGEDGVVTTSLSVIN